MPDAKLDSILLGVWRYLLPVPGLVWRKQVAGNGAANAAHLSFMSPEHYRVRNYVVRELPRAGLALTPAAVAASLDLPFERVNTILAELEKKLTFLYRDANRSVSWAYPVTVEPTPHRVSFSSGEQLYAA